MTTVAPVAAALNSHVPSTSSSSSSSGDEAHQPVQPSTSDCNGCFEPSNPPAVAVSPVLSSSLPPSQPPPIDMATNSAPRNEEQKGRMRSVLDYDTEHSLLEALGAGPIPNGYESTIPVPDEHLSDWTIDNLDPETSRPQLPEEEARRLQVLHSYLILDSERDSSFERIASLARNMFDVPIAILSLMDLGRQFFLAGRGIGDAREGQRKTAICSHTLMTTLDLVVVPDAKIDGRFANNPNVTEYGIRFYAGAPLLSPEGYVLGTICVCDTKARPEGLTLRAKEGMIELAALAMETIARRREDKLKMDSFQRKTIACTAHDLLTPLSGVQLSLSLLLEDAQVEEKRDQEQLHQGLHGKNNEEGYGVSGSLTNDQAELVRTAVSCGEVMHRICREAVSTFQGGSKARSFRRTSAAHNDSSSESDAGRGRDVQPGQPQLPLSAAAAPILKKERPNRPMTNEFRADRLDATPSLPDPSAFLYGKDRIHLPAVVSQLRKIMDAYPKRSPLEIVVDPDVPADIMSDELKIMRCAANFMTNACKNTPSGGMITLRISVVCDDDSEVNDIKEDSKNLDINGAGAKTVWDHCSLIRKRRRRLMVACRDTGPGISESKQHMLFRPYKIDAVGPSSAVPMTAAGNIMHERIGTGLGLFSVAENISGLGGEYGYRLATTADSTWSGTPGENNVTGSVFWFTVPIILPQEAGRFGANGAGGIVDLTPRQLQQQEQQQEKATHMAGVGAPSNTSFVSTVREEADFAAKKTKDSRDVSVPATKRSNTDNIDGMKKQTCPKIIGVGKDAPPKSIVHADDKGKSGAVNEKDKNVRVSFTDGVISSGSKQRRSSLSRRKRKKRALVIDDSLSIRKTLTMGLKKAGYIVCNAVNGMEGLSKMKQNCYDVVLCDFLMPVMDGLDCVQQYRDWEAKNRGHFRHFIVGISAHADLNDARRGIEAGMDGFVVKPVPLRFLKSLPGTPEVMESSNALDALFERGVMTFEDELDILSTSADESSGWSSSGSHDQPICLICAAGEEVATVKVTLKAVEAWGWKTRLVRNGLEALRLLKMRSWDAVLFDEDLAAGMCGTECLNLFREWEGRNRVARQMNVVYLGSFGGVAPLSPPSSRQLTAPIPAGFDCAMRKPVQLKQLSMFLQEAKNNSSKDCKNIMLR